MFDKENRYVIIIMKVRNDLPKNFRIITQISVVLHVVSHRLRDISFEKNYFTE